MSAPVSVPSPAWFAIALAPGLHAGHLRRAAGSEAATFDAATLVGRDERSLRALGLPPAAARALSAPDASAVAAARGWAQRAGVGLVGWNQPAYPPLLAAVEDAPVALWVRGDVAVLAQPQVALVGSRHPTAAGRRIASGLAASLARAGLTVVSGLARGIDAAAHEGALDAGGCSVAVCGTGPDECYPPRHGALAARIAGAGAVVTEFPPGTALRSYNFPRRNRIISGLSLGVVVVEAARDSGSLITARLAGEQGRAILAVPGSIQSAVTRGCHQLLREGARLVESAADVLDEVGWRPKTSLEIQAVDTRSSRPDAGRRLDKPGEMLLDALGFEPASVDDLIEKTGLPAHEIVSTLVVLELDGLVETLPAGRYGRASHL